MNVTLERLKFQEIMMLQSVQAIDHELEIHERRKDKLVDRKVEAQKKLDDVREVLSKLGIGTL